MKLERLAKVALSVFAAGINKVVTNVRNDFAKFLLS